MEEVNYLFTKMDGLSSYSHKVHLLNSILYENHFKNVERIIHHIDQFHQFQE